MLFDKGYAKNTRDFSHEMNWHTYVILVGLGQSEFTPMETEVTKSMK